MVSRRAERCQRAVSTRVNQRRWSLLGVGRTQEHRCQSGCELRARSSAQHAASSSQVRQFAFMPRPVEIARSPRWTVRGERTTRTPSRHSMGTSGYWVINLENKKEKQTCGANCDFSCNRFLLILVFRMNTFRVNTFPLCYLQRVIYLSLRGRF